MKLDFQKKGQHFFVVLLLLSLLMAMSACSKKANQDTQIDQANKALNNLFASTLQEAERLDSIFFQERAGSSASSTEGMVTSSGDGLMDYLEERFDETMTDKCLEQIIMNRLVTISINHVRNHQRDVEVSNLELEKRSESVSFYSFEVTLKLAGEDQDLDTMSGTILMLEEDGVWKADQITLN